MPVSACLAVSLGYDSKVMLVSQAVYGQDLVVYYVVRKALEQLRGQTRRTSCAEKTIVVIIRSNQFRKKIEASSWI